MNRETPAKRAIVALAISAAAVLMVNAIVQPANAQTPANSDRKPDTTTVQTFYLANVADANDLNDIQTSLRNTLPGARIFAISSQYALTVRGTQEDLDAAQKLITSLDRPRKVYRLTYTITDSDSGKRTGAQKLVVLATMGQRSTFKQGTRVPIVTGMYEKSDSTHENTQVQYVDVGLMIDATVTGAPDALSLHSKIEQTGVVGESTPQSERLPKIRQNVLDESFQLVQGKPLILASFDVPGSTRHQEIEVIAEPAR